MKIGVLALQGGVIEHLKMLKASGANAIEVNTPIDLEKLDGLIIPGGESTTISQLMQKHNFHKPIIRRHKEGMAVYGTCAGAIMLAKKIVADKKVNPLGLMPVSMDRNAYGGQVESFEKELKIKVLKKKFNCIFIRAPIMTQVNGGVEVLAEFNGKPVLAKKEKLLLSTFHPELTRDKRIHELFVEMCLVKKC